MQLYFSFLLYILVEVGWRERSLSSVFATTVMERMYARSVARGYAWIPVNFGVQPLKVRINSCEVNGILQEQCLLTLKLLCPCVRESSVGGQRFSFCMFDPAL